ncbi:MAG: NosD domain-containing protein [Nanoarchaeota archaeon]
MVETNSTITSLNASFFAPLQEGLQEYSVEIIDGNDTVSYYPFQVYVTVLELSAGIPVTTPPSPVINLSFQSYHNETFALNASYYLLKNRTILAQGSFDQMIAPGQNLHLLSFTGLNKGNQSYDLLVETAYLGERQSQTFLLTTNNPPLLYLVADAIEESQMALVNVSAIDPDADPVALAINDSRFQRIADNFVWQTGYHDAGSYDVMISAFDGLLMTNRSITVQVAEKLWCNDTVTGFQVLDHNIGNCSSLGIILGENASLYCDGVNISGTGSGTGIWVAGSHATVAGCTITQFGTGMLLQGSNGSFGGNAFLSNQLGIRVNGSWNTIYQNTFTNQKNANETLSNNAWNLSLTGNNWSDFPQNPGFPYRYEVPGPGDGVDWHPIYNSTNHPPVMSNLTNQSFPENQTLIIDVNATDPDNDTLTFGTNASLALPSPSSFNSSTGLFRWTTTFNDSGSYVVSFNVTDGMFSDRKTITITVTNVNRPPVLASMQNYTLTENQTLLVDANATDPDNQSLAFSLLAPPTNMTINSSTGLIRWTPGLSQAGNYTITVRVTDGLLNDTKQFMITVQNYLSCGDSISQSTILTRDLNCPGRGLTVISANVDLDCQGHAIRGSNLDDGVWIQDLANVTVRNCEVSGFLEGVFWYGGSGYRLLDSYLHNNIYVDLRVNGVSVSGVSGNRLAASQRGIHLGNLGSMDSTRINITNNTISANEWGIESQDAVNNTIWNNTFLNNLVQAVSTYQNDWNRTVGNYWSDFPNNTGYPLRYEIGGGGTGMGGVDYAPIWVFAPPQVTNLSAIPNPVGQDRPLNLSATVLSPLPLSVVFEIDHLMNLSTRNMSSRYMNLSPATYPLGNHTFRVIARDYRNQTNASESMVFTVRDVTPPRVTNLTAIPNPVVQYLPINLSARVTDQNNVSAVLFEIDGLKNLTGSRVNDVYFTLQANTSVPGAHAFRVIANDSQNNINRSELSTYNVTAGNRPPSINSSPVTVATETFIYLYDVNASDPDNNTLSYALAQFPQNMTINSSTGLIRWMPGLSQAGLYNITVVVTDGQLNASQDYLLTVQNFLWCGDSILGNLTLGHDIGPCDRGLVIAANNLLFNCSRHRIFGRGNGTAIAIVNRTGVQVTDCLVDTFAYGIAANGTNLSAFTRNRLFNHSQGALMLNGKGLRVSANNISEANWGIILDTGREAAVEDNAIDFADYGILTFVQSASNISRNNISHAAAGILLYGSSFLIVAQNRVMDSSEGLFGYGLSNGRLEMNRLTGNAQGMVLDGAISWMNITNNTLIGGYTGIFFYDTMNSRVTGNNITGQVVGLFMNASSQNTVAQNAFSAAVNANETADSLNNRWNTSIGNQWSDFPQNPGYPLTYIVPGPGNGVDYRPVGQNHPPVLAPIPNRTVNESETLVLDINATDEDNQTLVFGTDASAVLPGAVQFNSTTGILVWTPAQGDAGTYVVLFNVTDGILADNGTSWITVVEDNLPPTQGDPVLVSEFGSNLTEENLICMNQSTLDPEGGRVENVFNWMRVGDPFYTLLMPFPSDEALIKDYAGQSHGNKSYGPTWNDSAYIIEFSLGQPRKSIDIPGSVLRENHTLCVSYIPLSNPPDDSWQNNSNIFYYDGKTWNTSRIDVEFGKDYDLSVEMYDYLGGISGDWNSPNNVSVPFVENWYCYVFRNNASLRNYVNGTFRQQTNLTGKWYNLSTIDKINLGKGGSGRNNVSITNFLVVGEALSDAEIAMIQARRWDRRHSDSTRVGDVWQCAVTPNDGLDDGITKESNSLAIRPLGCGDPIRQSTLLDYDLINCTGNGLEIRASNITLDCGGHSLLSRTRQGYGIYIHEQSAITMKDCIIKNFSVAALVNHSQIVSLSGFLAENNSEGIYFRDSSHVIITNNTVQNHSYDGISVFSVSFPSTNVTVSRNHVLRNRYGISLSVNKSLISQNLAELNQIVGIVVQNNATQVTIADNRATRNQQGIILYSVSSPNISVQHNVVANNTFYGIRLWKTRNAAVSHNIVQRNAEGYRLDEAVGNRLWNNTLVNNTVSANETSTATGNQWNLSTVGNYWSDFPDNPGYPLSYVVPGPGDGVDWHPWGAFINITNHPPVMGNLSNQSIFENQTLVIDVNATDPDNDTLFYGTNASLALPSPSSFNTSTGLFQWTPSFSSAGAYAVGFNVSDGNLSDRRAITITVVNVNRPPVITTSPPLNATEGVPYIYDMNATDPDNETLTYLLPVAPANMSINASTGLIRWVPNASQVGNHSVVVRATDGQANATQSYTLRVFDFLYCGDNITQSTVMVNDVLNCPGFGLQIRSDNITLDCNGHRITGAPGTYGIHMTQRNNITVKGCTVEGFSHGTAVYQYRNRIINNTFRLNSEGIYLHSINGNNLIEDNTLDENLNYGLRIHESSANVVRNNVMRENGLVDLFPESWGADNPCANQVEGNIGSGNRPILFVNSPSTVYGLSLSELVLCMAHGSTVTNITVEGSAVLQNNGLYFMMTNTSTVTGSRFIGNRVGISAFSSSRNAIAGNQFEANGENAYENDRAVENAWNLSTIGNWWSDFGQNPGYPYYYEISGPGAGIDWHPIGGILQIDPNRSSVFLTASNMAGMTTCPAGDSPPYQFLAVVLRNAGGNPVSGIPASRFTFLVSPVPGTNTQCVGSCSATFNPWDAQTNASGTIRFEIIGDTSMVGNLSIQARIDNQTIPDAPVLPCKPLDITVDGAVGLPDFTLFGRDYNSTEWRSDFTWDGYVGLGDFSMFGGHYTHHNGSMDLGIPPLSEDDLAALLLKEGSESEDGETGSAEAEGSPIAEVSEPEATPQDEVIERATDAILTEDPGEVIVVPAGSPLEAITQNQSEDSQNASLISSDDRSSGSPIFLKVTDPVFLSKS